MIDYLRNRITGNETLRNFNRSVKKGVRAGKMRNLNIPYTRFEGLRIAKTLGAQEGGLSRRLLRGDQIKEIKRLHSEERLTIRELARRYGTSTSAILRALHVY